MPPRVAKASVLPAQKKKSTKKSTKRQLDAYAIAGKVIPEKSTIRSHRFGEIENSGPSKRGRDSDEDEVEDRAKRDKRRREQDEDVEYGSDSEGNEWTIGAVGEDDESIDSDEAFGESDEERFEGFKFSGSSKTKRPKQAQQEDLDLDEDSVEEIEDDEFGDEGVDLATMLDDDESDNEVENDDDESSSEDEESDNDEEKHARLQDFVEGLDGTTKVKKSAESTDDTLTLDDLLEDADLDSKTLATLKPKKKHAAQLVTAPLPKRQQDAIDRKIADRKAKEQLDRYQDTVIQNRRAEFLSFPLRYQDEAEPMHKDTFAPAQQETPTTELETKIREIMEASGMVSKPVGDGQLDDGEEDILKAEELGTNKMPLEETLARRAELRRTRELMFREELKAKRIAKIKSKSYRRVHRKERERLEDKERMLLDPEGFANGDLNADEQELADLRRAEARMSTKHSTSKWARSLKATNRAVWDDDARAGVIEQARRQEELRRRIAGRDIHSDASDDDDDDDNEDIPEQLAKLTAPSSELKGLAGMKFMQTAEKRRKAENDATIASIQRDLNPDTGDVLEIEDEGLGRAIFGPKPTVQAKTVAKKRDMLEEGERSSDEEPDTHDSKPTQQGSSKGSKNTTRPLTATKIDVPSTTTSAWLSAPQGKKSKLDRKLARVNDDEAVIDTRLEENIVQATTIPHTEKDIAVGNTSGWNTVKVPTEDDEEAPMLSKAERNAAFHARAFAGDDVVIQFQEEKNALAEDEDEKESSSFMPGWGSWAGAGLTKAARKAAERQRHNPLFKTKVAGTKLADRKDAKLKNVIISEKTDRKGKKYMAPILPHQYEKKEEYERSLRMPLGPEWSTKETFQKNTRPRVVVKPGTIIQPMSRPLV